MDENENWLLGLSGGINSMAVLCQLHELKLKPKGLYIFYAHFKEHSPDTFQFVADGIRFARKHFDNVHVKITRNSILDFFEKGNMILHPAVSYCSKQLKIDAINLWAFENNIRIDLVGYVRHELKKRSGAQFKTQNRDLFALEKIYPIGEFTDEWCFEITKRNIGWYPAIYDIVNDKGKRAFKHNNCLPCKNMYPKDILLIKEHFHEYYFKAMELSAKLGKFWGRNEAEFYTTFGRDLGQDSTCEACKF